MLPAVHNARATATHSNVRLTLDFGSWSFEVVLTPDQAADLVRQLASCRLEPKPE